MAHGRYAPLLSTVRSGPIWVSIPGTRRPVNAPAHHHRHDQPCSYCRSRGAPGWSKCPPRGCGSGRREPARTPRPASAARCTSAASVLGHGAGQHPLRPPRGDPAEVEAAARAVGADQVIAGLPDGYDTQVGERGALLAAGERQLVAFARAWIADPALLILDEATSNLDAPSEARITDALHRLRAGRTTIGSPTGCPPSPRPTRSRYSTAASSISARPTCAPAAAATRSCSPVRHAGRPAPLEVSAARAGSVGCWRSCGTGWSGPSGP